ncbi:CRE-CUX-7 protein [Caenorhabditis remanei]|uniref:CRE-CUX-7 protein n=1 Tax=Caenorhabditis remanei TaxID=31234 RepID=E3MWG2_CAERE|nr:CRE-CUX-7 protein [Caenorhabditis remanei]
MARNLPAALDYLGSEAEDFNKSQNLYLKPMAVIKITVVLPRMTIPGQSISNWDLMERLKRAIDPIQMDSCKVRESNIDSVIFEAELLSLGIMQKTMKILDGFSMKVSGFAEPLKVKTKEAKLDFPSRHDWDVWFMKNKINEMKPGERPDTVYLAKIPVKWFCVSFWSFCGTENLKFLIFCKIQDGYNDLPSERRLRVAMEAFGAVRDVDIPICDPLRAQMNPKISGIQQKGFGLGQDVFFEAYVQYMEYKGFATAMDSLRNRKWAKRIDGRFFQALIKVDFDRSRHLSEAQIAKRSEERRQIETERLRQEEEELNIKRQEELKEKEEMDEKSRRREDRERKRRERREQERMAEEEKKRLEKERLEAEERARANRRLEGVRLLKFLFEKIEAREERRKKKEEDKLKEELSKIKELAEQPAEQEDALRQALLQQREIRMRERLKDKMKASGKEKKDGKKKEKKSKKERRKRSNRHDTPSSSSTSSSDNTSDGSDSSTSSSSDSESRRRRYRRKRRSDEGSDSRSHRHRSHHHQEKTRRRGS